MAEDARPSRQLTAAGRVTSHRSAGFTLVEALVALVVAGFLLPALARAMAGAWTATRTPMEVVSAMTLARDAASGASAESLAPALARGFVIDRTSADVTITILPSTLAPPPRGKDARHPDANAELDPSAVPAAMKLAIPASFGGAATTAAALPHRGRLKRISVSVRTPSGRRLSLDTIGLDDAAP